jgi:hypothetical protein
MNRERLLCLCIAAAAALGGCTDSPELREFPSFLAERLAQLARATVPGVAAPSRARSLLELGLRQYAQGDYLASEKNLQSALVRGLDPHDRVIAQKHLAWIHCAAERKPDCKAELAATR